MQATAWNPIVDGTMNGTNDLGGSFDVTRFQTAANCNGGANGQVCINVNTNNLTGLPVPGPNTQIVWAQASSTTTSSTGRSQPRSSKWTS
jgi:hypothetical protein